MFVKDFFPPAPSLRQKKNKKFFTENEKGLSSILQKTKHNTIYGVMLSYYALYIYKLYKIKLIYKNKLTNAIIYAFLMPTCLVPLG